MSRKRTPKDIIEQGLISAKSLTQFLTRQSHDKRTQKTTQKAGREFFAGRTATEAGQALGVSYQRATAIRIGIEKGKFYSPEFRDILREGIKEVEKPIQTPEGVWYFPDEKTLDKTYRTEVIKRFADKQDAINWWREIIGSEKYIVVVRQRGRTPGQDFYNVVGIGSRAERPRTYKAKKSGKAYKRREKQGEMELAQIRKKYIEKL